MRCSPLLAQMKRSPSLVVDVAQSVAADQGRELTARTDLDHLREAHRADLAAFEARLTWRFAGAMLAQTLAILGGVLAILHLLD